MKNILYLAIAAIAICAIAVGCGKKEDALAEPMPISDNQEFDSDKNLPEGDPQTLNLLCLCESEEEAKAIAEGYGIEFESFSYGVATFNSDKDMETLEKIAKEKDLPLIEINHKVQAFE